MKETSIMILDFTANGYVIRDDNCSVAYLKSSQHRSESILLSILLYICILIFNVRSIMTILYYHVKISGIWILNLLLFLFLERFNLWRQLIIIAHYNNSLSLVQISFWFKRGLNLKSLIQPLETLPVELTETH